MDIRLTHIYINLPSIAIIGDLCTFASPLHNRKKIIPATTGVKEEIYHGKK
jgi:hypothetical protein